MSQRPGRIVEEFLIDLDRGGAREDVVLTEAYTAIHNAVWLSVRRQVTHAPEISP
jgi:hypothetical protein